LVVAPGRGDNRLAQQQRGRAWLAAMSDYELADIGLSRPDLSRVFHPSFDRDLNQRGINF
jgi:uncharacterized protein YjiS (DUF1127 family)